MNRIAGLTALLAAALLLAGCPKKPTTVPEAKPSEPVASSAGTGAATGSSDAGAAQRLSDAAAAEAAAAAKNRILFDFDSAEIRTEFAPVIAAHGKRLAAGKDLRLRLEGNTDERGSAEYNVALGERRAQSVKRALLLQGATESQLTTVSYGEERPVADGHDESAWAQNRRVDIIYTGSR